MELLHKSTDDVKMADKGTKCLYRAAMTICKDSVNVSMEGRDKVWLEQLGHCASQALNKSVIKMIGIDEPDFNQNDAFFRAFVLGRSRDASKNHLQDQAVRRRRSRE